MVFIPTNQDVLYRCVPWPRYCATPAYQRQCVMRIYHQTMPGVEALERSVLRSTPTVKMCQT
jgi:hypothetical protein